MPPRSRTQPPSWMRPISERLSPTITKLVIVHTLMLLTFIMVRPTREFIQTNLALTYEAIAGGKPWQILTAPFVQLEPIQFFFNVLGLWFVGAAIERQLGTRRFLALYFVPALVGNLTLATLMFVFQAPGLFFGSSLGTLALFVAFGRIYDRMQARVFGSLVMEARTLALVLVGFALLMNLLQGAWIAFAGDVVALLIAYFMSGGRGAALFALWARLGGGSAGGRRKFQVVEGGRRPEPPARPGRQDPPRYLN